MNIWIIPALFALFAKLIVIFVYRDSILDSTFFKLMIMLFACHNLCEVLLFWEYFRGDNADYLLRTYHVVSLVALLSIVLAISDISGRKMGIYAASLMVPVGLVSSLILFTDLIVVDAAELGYVVTAVRGSLYFLFSLSALCLVANMLYLLVRGYISTNKHESQIRCTYMALALMPQIIAVFVVIILMDLGVQINGTVIFPIATTLFIFILLASENRHKMTDIRRFIPFSDERRTSNQIMDIFSKYAQDKANYRDSISAIEKLLVEHKYEKNDRNATYAAERMGMPRSSLYSLFNRLGIKKD